MRSLEGLYFSYRKANITPARISTISTNTASIGAAFLLPRDLLRLLRFVVAMAETSYRVYHNRNSPPRHPFSTAFRHFLQRIRLAARSVGSEGTSPVFHPRPAAVRSPKGDRDILFRKMPPDTLSETFLSVNRGNRAELAPEK